MKIQTTIVTLFLMTTLAAQNNKESLSAYTQKIPGTDVSFNMVPIPGGSFIMGSNDKEKGREADEGPQKKFAIAAFYMGAFEVTHEEYHAFFLDESVSQNTNADAITRPSPPYIDFSLGMGKEGGFPANSMQQYGALMYCKWLYKKTGDFYRLPTEAEWEYAARAGATPVYFFGNDKKELVNFAWFKNNSGNKYHKTGLLKPNAWGLYDMLGNVAEWTLDQYAEDYFDQVKMKNDNPVLVPVKKHPRTIKGGSYKDDAATLRPANRIKSELIWNRRDPQIPKSKWWNTDAPFVGFRIIRPLIQPSPEEIDAFFELYLNK